MILCFDCPRDVKRLLDDLIESGQYNGYEEVLVSALQNLHTLQREVSKKGAVFLDHAQSDQATSIRGAGLRQMQIDNISYVSTQGVPKRFQSADILASPPISLATLSDDRKDFGRSIPANEWGFGQHNKLFPAKANVRALSNLVLEKKRPLEPHATRQEIAERASSLGDYLRALDEHHGLTREQKLGTAFPTSDNAKSRIRYANQFVVSLNKNDKPSGLLFDYKFLDTVQSRSKVCVLPTEAAWEFARLPNPILDETGGTDLPKRFSPEEVAFLLTHIRSHVPNERFAVGFILMAVEAGFDNPSKLDAEIVRQLPPHKPADLTASFLSSQRAGVISRMSDLGLIERMHQGVRVIYLVTELGSAFLSEVKGESITPWDSEAVLGEA
jgi:hypothetical protein